LIFFDTNFDFRQKLLIFGKNFWFWQKLFIFGKKLLIFDKKLLIFGKKLLIFGKNFAKSRFLTKKNRFLAKLSIWKIPKKSKISSKIEIILYFLLDYPIMSSKINNFCSINIFRRLKKWFAEVTFWAPLTYDTLGKAEDTSRKNDWINHLNIFFFEIFIFYFCALFFGIFLLWNRKVLYPTRDMGTHH